jgi:hypothetical protein
MSTSKEGAAKPSRRRVVDQVDQQTLHRWDSNKDGRRVVLLDLDGTLMKSKEARSERWEQSLSELDEINALDPKHLDPKLRLSAYEAIYRCHKGITGWRGPRGHVFEDMRQEWNTRTSYALLVAWVQSPTFPGGKHDVSFYETALRGILADPDQKASLLGHAERIRDAWSLEYMKPLDRAVARFWQGDWSNYLYDGVLPFLRSLRENQISYYIATEGHVPTQWSKICALKLNQPDETGEPWVKQEWLLATSQAAQPRGDMDALNRLIERYSGAAAASQQAIDMLAENHPNEARKMADAARAADLTGRGLDRIAQLFGSLARKFYFRGRVLPSFYKRVVYAVNWNPDNPRENFVSGPLSWNDEHKLRVAMIGDTHQSDIQPMTRFAEESGDKIMSIWLREQGNGRKDIDKRPLDWEDRWVESATITQALELVLNRNVWLERTTFIRRPTGLFGSAIDPAIENHTNHDVDFLPANVETLIGNIDELIAGIALFMPNPAQSLGARQGVDSGIESRATRFVMGLLKSIVDDIRNSARRDETIDILLEPAEDDVLREGPLSKCQGSQQATVELLFNLAADENGRIEGTPAHTAPIDLLARLLTPDEQCYWANAVIQAVHSRTGVKEQIRASDKSRKLYIDGLVALRKAELPNWFPTNVLSLLIRELSVNIGASQPSLMTPVEGRTSGHSSGDEVVRLGYLSGEPLYQQSIYMGKNERGEDVYCLLGGPRARNIICICGSPGGGKSASIEALVFGALNGGGIAGAKPERSSGIIFHHDLTGASSLASTARELNFPVSILSLPDEVDQIGGGYPGLIVKPLRFNLEHLDADVILQWVGIGEGVVKNVTRDILQKKPRTFESVRDEVERSRALNKQQKRRILDALEEKLRPMVAETPNQAFEACVKPGALVIVDCGRVTGPGRRLPAWQMVLSTCAKHLESARKDEQYLLVFDELGIVFSQAGAKDYVAGFVSDLSGLANNVGRHQHMSIVAASQDPKAFRLANDLSKDASVVLIYRMPSPDRVPAGDLWELVLKNPGLSSLPTYEAWYCSRTLDGKALTTSRLTVERALKRAL